VAQKEGISSENEIKYVLRGFCKKKRETNVPRKKLLKKTIRVLRAGVEKSIREEDVHVRWGLPNLEA